MSGKREFLEESIEGWQEDEKDDRLQFLASFTVAATGLCMVGVGVKTITEGDVGNGIAEVVIGGGVAAGFGRAGLREISDYADSHSRVVARQEKLDKLVSK